MTRVPLADQLQRQKACTVCRARCPGYRAAASRWLQDASSACPQSAWPSPAFGLGDAVAAVAQPIAGAIDAMLGTKIGDCGGCRNRRAALNRLVPNLRRSAAEAGQIPPRHAAHARHTP